MLLSHPSQVAPLVVSCLMTVSFMLGLLIGNGIHCPCSVQVPSHPWAYVSSKQFKTGSTTESLSNNQDSALSRAFQSRIFTNQDLGNGVQNSEANNNKKVEDNVFLNKKSNPVIYRKDDCAMKTENRICNQIPRFKLSFMTTKFGKTPVYVHDEKSKIREIGSAFRLGSWERVLQNVLFELLEKERDAHFVDFGSNIGIYTLAVAKYGRRVISFDPYTINTRRICSSVVAGNFTKNVTLIYNSYPKYLETGCDATNKIKHVGAESEFHSMSTELDDVLRIPEFNFRKVVLKLDLPNREYHFLKCGQKFFDKVQVVAVLLNWNIARSDLENIGNNIIKFFNYRHFIALNPFNTTEILDTSKAEHWPAVVLWKNTLK